MIIRLVVISTCCLLVSCNNGSTSTEAGQIYAYALTELAPKVSHYTIDAERVELGTDANAPSMDQIGKYGTFEFKSPNGPLTAADFPNLDVTLFSAAESGWQSSDDCEAFWSTFNATYTQSEGFLKFSDVGFGENGTEAIFYFEGHSGCFSGLSALVVMKQHEDRWIVILKQDLWHDF